MLQKISLSLSSSNCFIKEETIWSQKLQVEHHRGGPRRLCTIIFLFCLIILGTITYCYHACVRSRAAIFLNWRENPPRPTAANEQDSALISTTIIELGLDEATVESFPKFLYSGEAKFGIDGEWSCCSICLADFAESDVLRLLPDCGHVFHHKCVDPRLRRRPTCPNCRTSPAPTPIATPLAELTPLAWES